MEATTVITSILILVGIRYFMKQELSKVPLNVLVWTVLAILMIKPIDQWTSANEIGYKQQQTVLDHLKTIKQPIQVISTTAQKNIGEYYLGFDREERVKFISYEEVPGYEFDPGLQTYLLLNSLTETRSGMLRDQLPLYARKVSVDCIKEFDNEYAQLYRIPDLNDFWKVEVSTYLQTINDFEKSAEGWVVDSQHITSEEPFSGGRCYRVDGDSFSCSYAVLLDKIRKDGVSDFSVELSIMARAERKIDALLIIAVEDGGEAPYWSAIQLEDYTKHNGAWNAVEMTRDIPNDLPSTGNLKVYIWNVGAQELFMDDFEVEILSY